jgi:BirA family biotin operon repressor/biotin-[acetyl-CoA-carboxylase] ligase
MSLEQRILCRLANGKFHSGQTLAEELGVSRASIWNCVKKLQAYGLEVYSIRGRGYRIPQPTELLNSETICQYIDQNLLAQKQVSGAQAPRPNIDLHWSLNSTNEQLLHSEQAAPAVCISEMQQNGRGRRGRQWLSPPGGNIYFSYKWQFNLGPAQLSALSLAVSVGVMRVLRRCGADKIGVKWPNDIVQNGRKLAGILLEMQGEAGGPCTVVVGIGINVRISADTAKHIDQPWTDLQQLTGKAIQRSQLVADLVCELSSVFQLYEQQQLVPFMDEWLQNDQLKQKSVSVRMAKECYTGIATGIDLQGNLIVDDDGVQRLFSSGEVSLRLRDDSLTLA